MSLNALQMDAVTELANIGISRATHQLANLLNEEVHMDVPKIEWVNSEEIKSKLSLPCKEVSCIYQNIGGKINGSAALLLYPEDSQALLEGLISPNQSSESQDIQKYQNEAIMEIANIIISSCISAMADTLCLELSISLPQYCQTNLEHLINSNDNAIMIYSRMESTQNHKGGQLQLLLSDSVANQVLNSIPDF